jgi:flagellar basal-body rod modification protein FlgD
MAIAPVSATTASNTNTTAAAAASTTSATGTQTLGINDFLQLLAVQMQNQDPLNPTSDTEFISQMASFSSLQQMGTLNNSMTSYISEQQPVDAQSYLGKQVTLTDTTGATITGTVSGISLSASSTPQIVVNGQSYDPSTVTSIVPATSSTTAPSN